MKSCPSCAELVREGGCRCPHCGASVCSRSLPAGAVLLGLVLNACNTTKPIPPYGLPDSFDTNSGANVDTDGDGYDALVDCDDNNAAIHPEAEEVAGDGVDSNCDGEDDT